jgi:pimeloyl-ACP methyl ester carboxylesterase/DNA-binding SARP family transcriptional activator
VTIRLSILGPLQVTGPGGSVEITGPQERRVLAVLAAWAGDVISTDQLVDALWGQWPPRSSLKVLHNLVLRLRKALGADVIETRPGGYVLRAAPDAVDVQCFDRLVSDGRRYAAGGDLQAAAAALSTALELWRGSPLVELEDWLPVRGEVARLHEQHCCVREELASVEVASGHDCEYVARLEAMVSDEPLRERRWRLLMLALYRCGRQADALRAFQRARNVFAEVGLEPGLELRTLERDISIRAATLDIEQKGDADRSGTAMPLESRRHNLPVPLTRFVGRAAELDRIDELLGTSRIPETHYAKAGDGVHIAYQVTGAGPLDVVMVPGFVSHVELAWEMPFYASMFRRLGSFARVISFDKRGTGLSDQAADVPTLEQRMDDVRTVMDTAGVDRVALWGISEGGPMALLFAATYPERTTALVLQGSFARIAEAPDHQIGFPPEPLAAFIAEFEEQWGTGEVLANYYFPSAAGDPAMRERFARWERNGASPGAMVAVLKMSQAIDVRSILATISVPTLVVHCTGDPAVPVEHGRHLAEHIPGARYIELPGDDHLTIREGDHGVFDDIEEFLTGTRPEPEIDRVLKTVLFTDIVKSTERAASMGDRRWHELLDAHDAAVRAELEHFRGQEVQITGDGFLACFDGPARAIRCALAITERSRTLGIEVRAGLHTGECETRGDNLAGVAVHIAARVAAIAHAGEVLCSRTVTDLVAGSGICFVDRGVHSLKGVPGTWQTFAVG